MKNAAIILVALFMASAANAQVYKPKDNTSSHKDTVIEKPENSLRQEAYEVTVNNVFLKKKLAKEINAKQVNVTVDSVTHTVIVLIDTSKADFTKLSTKLVKKGYYLSLKHERQKPLEQTTDTKTDTIVEKPQLSKEKYNPEIDKFLNREDQTIFTDFQQFPYNEIHPQRREFYQLVKSIHEFDDLVAKTGNLKANQFSQIKQNLAHAEEINSLIKMYATDEKGKLYYLLTETQKEYYRNIVKTYQKLLEDYNL
jgi:hypothetical protein